MAEFLFEIGFEEMPAGWLADLAKQLETKFLALASEAQIAPSGVRVFWTSRRLVLVADVKTRQDDRTVTEWGPAGKIAKDAAGAWSKAAEGFARKQGVGLDALKLAPKTEGSVDLYLSATKAIPGRDAGEVLASMLPSLLRGFTFAKRMNWDAWLDDGRGAFEFGRPIQWIVALLNGEVVPVSIFDAAAGAKGAARVSSGRRSVGNRFYPRGAADRGFDVSSFSELQAALAKHFVILDPKERAARIAGQVERAGGNVEGDAAHLVEEWRDLVEFPTVVIGSIPKEFADLPSEVLETVLAHHQKAAMLPPSEEGAPRFAAISGCDEIGAANAARGQERVVVARLKDARFFFDEDRKRPLADRVQDLAQTLFHKGLGSYETKTGRMQNLAGLLGRQAGLDEAQVRDAARAALLAKADLGTLMVREFPELQGIIGGLYATNAEAPQIAEAIRWHYHPVAVERTSLPAGRMSAAGEVIFAVVSLSEKLDTLIAYFALGVVPTGSSDPYGLRRAGQGVVRILLDFWPERHPPDLELCVSSFFDWRPGVGDVASTKENQTATWRILQDFLLDRLRAVFPSRGDGSPDEVEAVLSTPRVSALGDIRAAARRLQALAAVRSEQPEVFLALAEAFKRAKNIVAGQPTGDVAKDRLPEAAEKRLFAAIEKAEATPASNPEARLRAVAGLRGEVDEFFKGVMVMSDDHELKANRLALLSRLLNLVYEVADLSKLVSPAGEAAVSS